MHKESYRLMADFVERYVRPPCFVADVGSLDVNGTFRPLFGGCDYTGLDIEPGTNVDVVVEPYYFGFSQYDVVISGSVLEHVEDMGRWAKEVERICKPDGLICVIAPHDFPEHRYPKDCWRILPDGMRWLFRGLEILECRAGTTDTILIARHP